MLIKISDGRGGWVLLDNADQVHFTAERLTVTDRDQLNATIPKGDSVINLVPAETLREGRQVNIAAIEFYRWGQKMTALFTSVAFICNDKGDTLERVTAERRPNPAA